MKIFALSFIAAASYSVSAWVFPHAVERAVSIASVTAAISTAPMIANAADLTGSYSDPKHPNCQREIVVNGLNADIKGTDGTPGCPPDGSGKAWKLQGKINAEGDSIFVDFSPKGGPKDLKGAWDGSGIKWPDGNKWTIKPSDA